MDKRFIKKKFIERLGYPLNLNNPQTFNEKIHWLQLNERSSYKTLCVDKYEVRDIIKKLIGEKHLIPLHFQCKTADGLDSFKWPNEPIIIKTNHASGQVFILKSEKQFVDEIDKIKKQLTKQLNYNFYHAQREWQYKNISPCIIVEKLLLMNANKIPNDYKFHCFNGKAKFIQVDSERFTEHRRIIYDTNWQEQKLEWRFPKANPTAAPPTLNKMIQLAEKLAAQFSYVRVDLYEVNNQIYFGELTFTPAAGLEPFHPEAIDKEWGEELNL